MRDWIENRSAMVQKTIESLKEDDELVLQLDDDQSKMALLVQAALQGEQGVDCAAIYPHCSLPFREESRDRRRWISTCELKNV